jgi:hypothetical protein
MKHLIFITLAGLFVFSSCSSPKKMHKSEPLPSLRLYAGLQKGGIIENTDMGLIDNAVPDAFTGATRTGFHAGVHYEYYLKNLSFESGLDYIGNKQTFKYADNSNNYYGERNLFTNQFRIPFSLNFRFFHRTNPDGILKLKLGISPGFSIITESASTGDIPEYSTSHFTMGPLFSLELNPFPVDAKFKPGFYFSVFRSAQSVYNDFYQTGEMPGLSLMSFGISYKIK